MRPGKAGTRKSPASRSTSWSPRFCRSGTKGTGRATRICSRDHHGSGRRLGLEGVVTASSPVGLDEDLFERHSPPSLVCRLLVN